MRIVRWGAFVTWLIVAGLAVAGFAAFSPQAAAPAPESAVAPVSPGRGSLAGRITAMAFAVGTRDHAVTRALPITAAAPDVPSDPSVDSRPVATTTSRPAAPSTTAGPPDLEPTVPVDEYRWPNGSRCDASWYGPGFEGRPTASGESFDPGALTAAIHDVPFDTLVVVTRTDTGASVTVRVNDRGPYVWDEGWRRHDTRCIDLSPAAMQELAGIGEGVIPVSINY